MIRSVFLLTALLACAGCVGNYTGRPEERGPRNIEARTRPDLARKVEWRRIMRGAGKQSTLLGYVKTDVKARAGGAGTYWIYDESFRLVGRLSPRGSVVRISPAGEETWVGNYSLELACLTLFGYTVKKTILFEPMPDPRG